MLCRSTVRSVVSLSMLVFLNHPLRGAPGDAVPGETSPAATAVLTGTVVDPAGVPCAGAVVTAARPEARAYVEAVADASGAFVLAGLAPGRWLVTARCGERLAAAAPVDLRAGETRTLPIALLHVAPRADMRVVAPFYEALPDVRAVPGGAAVIDESEIRGSLAHTFKDVLAFTPGVLAQPRSGADESQLSIRGSGLRSNYHARGVNLLVNGIPYQDADGFSDYEALDLLATERVEVWK
ncbi:MAG: carboxypeptidase regulatory-like domain-containing protein, partial [Gemmatimonadales bacterium]